MRKFIRFIKVKRIECHCVVIKYYHRIAQKRSNPHKNVLSLNIFAEKENGQICLKIVQTRTLIITKIIIISHI